MTCKDCIHYKVCDDKRRNNHTVSQSTCKHFADKSLVVELPCKVGDTVYGIMMGKVVPLKIGAFIRGECKLLAEARDKNGFICYLENNGYIEWYLTRAEAEKALEGME